MARVDAKRTQLFVVACFLLQISFFPIYLFSRVELIHTDQQAGGFIQSSPIGLIHQRATTTDSRSFTINPILRHMHFASDHVFSVLLVNHPNPTDNDYVLEVGCHSLSQSSFAASQGFEVVSFDPSPLNFARMEKQYHELPDNDKKRIELVNKAVSDRSGSMLEFLTSGGTGDHVMGVNLDQREHRQKTDTPIEIVQVETIALDDAIEQILEKDEKNSIYMVKIDTQGHEGSVMRGLQRSMGKIRYILLEYWVDALDQANGVEMGTCSGIQDILTPLHEAGYDLFDLALRMHPQGQFPAIKFARSADFFRPMDPLQHSKWFSSRGKQAREEHGYQMGYWTDILAVNTRNFGDKEMGDLTLMGRTRFFRGTDAMDAITNRLGWNQTKMRRENGLKKVPAM